MSNKLILDLTVRLTEALDLNYDVVNMDTVLAVISALEGATITKEQLETTRLAKHINQLRRRNKSNILAIRAKNLLKKWREMFGITSHAQSEVGGTSTSVTSSVTQQATSTQQGAKSSLLSLSQPVSPNTNTQLLGEQFDNSLSSIGVDFNRTTTTTNTTQVTGGGSGSISNTTSANFKFNKKSAAGIGGDNAAAIGSRSNGALGKSTNRNVTNNSSPATIANATTISNKVKHPTSFKNLITGFNVHNAPKQTNSSALSPKVLPSISRANARKMFIIDEDHNQSLPSSSTSGAQGIAKSTVVGVTSPRTHKSMKRKERNSPVMTYLDQSSSPIAFENLSHEQTTMATGRFSAPHHPSNRNQIVTSTIDLHDSNSSSNFAGSTEIVSSTTTTTATSSKVNGGCNSGTTIGISSNSSSNKRIRKDKKRSNERELIESEHFEPTIDESSRIAFPISGIQEYLSLSNSSMSIFPAGSGVGGGNGTERFQSTANEDNQKADSSTERDKTDGDLTFAGKFKLNSAGGIDVESSSSYYKGGGGGGTTVSTGGLLATRGENNMSVITSGLDGGGNGVAINNTRAGSGMATASTLGFHPFSRNSNESSSNSRTSQLDLIDVVNQDSESMITVDDLRQLNHQKQSSNEKSTPQDNKFPKDVINNASKQQQQQHRYSSKEYNVKSRQPNASTRSSKPSTPNSSVMPIVVNVNATSPPVVEQKVPKKRGRKKGSKGVDSVLAQSAGLNTQFLMSPALGSNKKVKTTRELLIDIQSRKKGSSATSSPTLMNWFGTSRPESSCSEPSLHSPRTFDANSTNATMSIAARSTPEKNASNNSIAADELYESDSDTNTSEPSHKNTKSRGIIKKTEADGQGNASTTMISSIEEQIKELMAMLPPIDKQKIDWDTCEDVPCTCSLREIPPEVPVAVNVETENTLDLLENVDSIKNEEDDEEPVISVSILPITPQQPALPVVPSRSSPHPTSILPHHHTQSAPVSTVTSPALPPTTTTTKIGANNQNLPTKSIFDLDFDDDNDPLHMFVEAASRTKNGILSHQNNCQESSTLKKKLKETQEKDEEQEDLEKETSEIKAEHSIIKSQSEQKNRPNKMPIAQQQQQTVATPPTQQQQEPSDQQVMPMFMNFPTYEVVEDPACEAKQRYEIQTNQITKFHINAFHNCYIPNVNGNWDHSIPTNNVDGDDEWLQLENDRLYANVVPKYGCLVKERIPKDLSYIKFTSNFKPNLINKKSDKPPPLPFLGVANIHRRQHFHLHHYHRNSKKKEEIDKEGKKRSKNKKKKKTQTQTQTPSRGITKKCKEINVKEEIKIETKTDKEENQNITNVFLQETKTNITKKASNTLDNINIDTNTQIPPIAIKIEDASDKMQSEHQESINASNSFMIVSGNNNNLKDDNIDHHQQKCPNINNLIKHSSQEENSELDVLPLEKSRLNSDQTQLSLTTEDDEDRSKSSPVVINGNVPHLTNNNNIIKNEGDNGLSCQKKTPISNHQMEMKDADEIAASRRSSSCSNSSLKQNQNSINMKLRQHRMETLRLSEKQQKRKRKRLAPPKTNDFEAIMIGREEELQPKVSPLIKRIKLVNGHYAAEAKCPANNMTDSSCLDDNDSDCYHIHSENEIITEEEDDPQPEDEDDDDFEEVVDDYDDEEYGDDEEEVEEVCGDFHEVVTRDMTSSATGNNHIVLTIKKTPSKTNSPSSSSMSPAPMLVHNLNANTKISSRQVDDVALLIDDDENDSNSKLELGKLLGLNSVKANKGCLINKTDYFLPESTDVAVYNFQLKKNADEGNDDNDMRPLPITDDNDEGENQEQGTEQTPSSAGFLLAEPSPNMSESRFENPNNLEDKEDKNDEKSQKRLTGKHENLTRVELAESIRQTKKCFRRIEMKRRLCQGIEQAQKLHRQLFFPYELHNSCGSKILEINSCTSDCTDPSDDDTTDSSDSDSELTTSSSSGNGNLKSRVIKIKRRRRTKPQPSKRITVADGGGNPPSSSSSSSSSSSDSSSSASAFTSWTTSEDDEDDEKVGKKRKQPIKAENMNQDYKEEEEIKPEEEVQTAELPSGNNFLLRSFNHIYVSTEERQRQQIIKQALEYRQYNEVSNNGGVGYITLSGDDSKDETMTTMPLQQQTNEGYLNYFDVNSRYNVYGSQTANTSSEFPGSSSSLSRQKPVSSSSPTTVEDTSVDVETIELPSAAVEVLEDDIAEGVDKPSTVILSSLDIDVELMDPIVDKSTSENNSNNPINSDRNVGSININKNNIVNNNRIQEISVKTEQLEKTKTEDEKTAVKTEIKEIQNEEDNLVAQEEYRTGIRRVDEDVVDEDGNNCARTQQFKEWHEVLQLRSYNDELLTVLPYVVIE
ncbi:mediator of RNA polymerase II transcription subunit 26 [Eupeodes corollae]|uniref:mediator of RNA polymerase II transcription subunit 26 n=1 Tax=Eupeodes corollae TaxID=290404 RepID=UPI00248F4D00|nr:mediator of RNA polymerase II transcription subunit 26 [Eupeodes corollae]XP_055922035.1 mediator of RNA polymerase II transcription subunit 26 [Eupeodes corollae]XP_055922036.1 mediator of RNA polymerase II transcription subunit 26 [Eupeodes corollae]